MYIKVYIKNLIEKIKVTDPVKVTDLKEKLQGKVENILPIFSSSKILLGESTEQNGCNMTREMVSTHFSQFLKILSKVENFVHKLGALNLKYNKIGHEIKDKHYSNFISWTK